jgi:hypothetical protein
LTNDPAMARSALAVRPINPALRNRRREVNA